MSGARVIGITSGPNPLLLCKVLVSGFVCSENAEHGRRARLDRLP